MTIRLLELTQRYPPALGGVEQHVDHLARSLRTLGFEVRVSATDLDRDRPFRRLPGPMRRSDGTVRRHRAIRLVRAPHGLGILGPGLAADALRAGPDVLHAHAFGFFPTWAGALAHDLRRTPLVITPHFDPTERGGRRQLYERLVSGLTLARADRVVAQTDREARSLVRLGVERGRLVTIPTPIDLEEFPAPGPRAERSGRAIALFVGRIHLAQKGLDRLVDALARLPEAERPDVRLVGEDWGDRASIERLADGLGVRDRITFTGPLPRAEVIREYAGADLFVLPSRSDSSPVVLREAMAMGLPVVASNVGGIPEMVREEVDGLIVDADDPSRLAQAIGRLAADGGLRRRLGAAGRRRAEELSWERLAPRYVALFESVSGGTV